MRPLHYFPSLQKKKYTVGVFVRVLWKKTVVIIYWWISISVPSIMLAWDTQYIKNYSPVYLTVPGRHLKILTKAEEKSLIPDIWPRGRDRSRPRGAIFSPGQKQPPIILYTERRRSADFVLNVAS
jgi:hypothetical protein